LSKLTLGNPFKGGREVPCVSNRIKERVDEQDKQIRFQQQIMPHLDAAYNLAHWLIRNASDAEDVVQEAFLRAFKFFDGFHGGNSRAWLLAIVRNVTYDWLRTNSRNGELVEFDEELHAPEESDFESQELRAEQQQVVRQAIQELPVGYREVTILRELEGVSYKEIAEIVRVPVGTVMSRLARARHHLQRCLPARFRQAQSL
jgi:RNA polymerase sigma-70 factor (ECF subfamily)